MENSLSKIIEVLEDEASQRTSPRSAWLAEPRLASLEAAPKSRRGSMAWAPQVEPEPWVTTRAGELPKEMSSKSR